LKVRGAKKETGYPGLGEGKRKKGWGGAPFPGFVRGKGTQRGEKKGEVVKKKENGQIKKKKKGCSMWGD